MTAATHSEFSIKSNFCLKDIPTSPGLCFDEEKVHNNTMVLPCYMSKIAQYDQKNGNTMIFSWWLTVAMLKMLSGVVLLLASSVTQPKSEAMSLSQLMVSSVWRCTMPSTSSYCWLDASNSWEASSNSMWSSLTFGHSVNQTISTWNNQGHW